MDRFRTKRMEGASGSNLDTPRSRPPKNFQLVFVQVEIFGKTSGAADAQEFCLGTWYVE